MKILEAPLHQVFFFATCLVILRQQKLHEKLPSGVHCCEMNMSRIVSVAAMCCTTAK